jgi:hypothetical protein
MSVNIEPEDPAELEAWLRAGHTAHISVPRLHAMVSFCWEPRAFTGKTSRKMGGETEVREVFVLEQWTNDGDQLWTYEDDKFEDASAHWALLKRGIAPHLAEWIIDNF